MQIIYIYWLTPVVICFYLNIGCGECNSKGLTMKISSITKALVLTAMVGSSFGVATASLSTTAEAKTITKWEHINRDKCYKAKKIPATVKYTTNGKLKKAAGRVWVGNAHKKGGLVIDQYQDAVYFQTREVIEDQHISLVPTACPKKW